MHTFEHTVEIAAPVERVVAFDADPENWPRTMASLTDLEIVEETGDHTRMNATYRILGIPVDGRLESSVDESTEELTVTFDSPGMTGEARTRYAETDAGTRVVQRVEYAFGDSLLERALEPVAKRYNERQFRTHLQNTKALVEAEATVRA